MNLSYPYKVGAMPNPVARRIASHKKNATGGVLSVCSAHPEVIRAAVDIVGEYDEILLIESTSNQVDQFGGYTGKTPAQFITEMRTYVAKLGFPEERLVFGGDHLGPNAWQHLPAEQAMENAGELVRQYAAAGYEKIHLDCSMSCADDPVPLEDHTVAERAAALCKIAESVHAARREKSSLVYSIGTEVPVPGGARENLEAGIAPTTPDAARNTYETHRRIFAAAGLGEVWPRILGLVVQPGVEFDHHQVIPYRPERAQGLSALANTFEHAVFEAHSTDYQPTRAFKDLVNDHFAILKVGPALTFAYREALFALNDAARAFYGDDAAVDLREAAEKAMLAQPEKWRKYYPGTPAEQKILRAYSLSDRIRYYWPDSTLEKAVRLLREQIDARPLPFGLLHQYLAAAVEACHENNETRRSDNLIRHHIRFALRPYLEAVHPVNA